MGIPHFSLNGQALAISAEHIEAGAVGTSEIDANAVTRAKMSTSNVTPKYSEVQKITFSGGMKSFVTTGFNCSFVSISPPLTPNLTATQVIINASTITNSHVLIKGWMINPAAAASGVHVAAGTYSFIATGY